MSSEEVAGIKDWNAVTSIRTFTLRSEQRESRAACRYARILHLPAPRANPINHWPAFSLALAMWHTLLRCSFPLSPPPPPSPCPCRLVSNCTLSLLSPSFSSTKTDFLHCTSYLAALIDERVCTLRRVFSIFPSASSCVWRRNLWPASSCGSEREVGLAGHVFPFPRSLLTPCSLRAIFGLFLIPSFLIPEQRYPDISSL